MPLPLDFVRDELFDLLERLEPHGYGNPKPTFSAGMVRVNIERRFGKGLEHVSMTVEGRLPAVFWRGARHLTAVSPDIEKPVDIVFQLDRDRRNNAPVLNIKDMGFLLPS